MRTYLLNILFLLLISSFVACSQNNSPKAHISKDIFGCWSVENYRFLPISSIEDSEVNNLLQKLVCLQNDKVIIFDEIYSNPQYTYRTVNADSYLKNEFGVKKNELEIKSDSLLIINIKFPGTKKQDQEVVLDHKKLYIFQDGAMFIFIKKLKRFKQEESSCCD